MTWSALFALTNLIALAGWLALLLLPRRPLVLSTVLFGSVGLLCLAYVAMFIALFGGFADPVRVAGAEPVSLANYSDYSIEGLRPFFMSDGGIVIGWTHYLAFDLFVGQWIARDADAKGFGRLIQVPILLATYLAGPIGLFVWLLIGRRRRRDRFARL